MKLSPVQKFALELVEKEGTIIPPKLEREWAGHTGQRGFFKNAAYNTLWALHLKGLIYCNSKSEFTTIENKRKSLGL